MENQRLTVKGERKLEVEDKEEKFHRIERRLGSFYAQLYSSADRGWRVDYSEVRCWSLAIPLAKKEVAKQRHVKI